MVERVVIQWAGGEPCRAGEEGVCLVTSGRMNEE